MSPHAPTTPLEPAMTTMNPPALTVGPPARPRRTGTVLRAVARWLVDGLADYGDCWAFGGYPLPLAYRQRRSG